MDLCLAGSSCAWMPYRPIARTEPKSATARLSEERSEPHYGPKHLARVLLTRVQAVGGAHSTFSLLQRLAPQDHFGRFRRLDQRRRYAAHGDEHWRKSPVQYRLPPAGTALQTNHVSCRDRSERDHLFLPGARRDERSTYRVGSERYAASHWTAKGNIIHTLVRRFRNQHHVPPSYCTVPRC